MVWTPPELCFEAKGDKAKGERLGIVSVISSAKEEA